MDREIGYVLGVDDEAQSVFDDEPGEFWLWTEVFLAGALAVLLVDSVVGLRLWSGILSVVLFGWQARKAARAVRQIIERRAD